MLFCSVSSSARNALRCFHFVQLIFTLRDGVYSQELGLSFQYQESSNIVFYIILKEILKEFVERI